MQNQYFHDLANRLDPPTATYGRDRVSISHLLARLLHFGRINGIGIPATSRVMHQGDEARVGAQSTRHRPHVRNRYR